MRVSPIQELASFIRTVLYRIIHHLQSPLRKSVEQKQKGSDLATLKRHPSIRKTNHPSSYYLDSPLSKRDIWRLLVAESPGLDMSLPLPLLLVENIWRRQVNRITVQRSCSPCDQTLGGISPSISCQRSTKIWTTDRSLQQSGTK